MIASLNGQYEIVEYMLGLRPMVLKIRMKDKVCSQAQSVF